ncbi:hypothetical protein LTR70_009807 [Exophiala xenobiotica]|uniref:RING-type domain-containing protein n=1 Tax=Lithohypha guttulata TaxID=1690604 RepID=A0ABR0JW66_9EURO|nr:hypothetical protein LTR24_009722 [Lithohypha guttulata]KAK5310009.1 hypothetical protein LTR70_009807 [Exophiala xenobiotica]
MDSTQSAPAVKQKKGIKKLWAKIRLSLKSGPSASQTSTATTTTAQSQKTPASQPAQPTSNEAVLKEPAVQPEPAVEQSSQPNTAANPSTAQPQTASSDSLETPKVEEGSPMQDASAPEHTPLMSKATWAETPQPGAQKQPEIVKPPDTIFGIGVIEVDDNEDEEVPINLSRKYLSGRSADDKAKYERARAIFEKYGMTLDPADWHAPSKLNVERVHKKKRQRVHWTCHECQTSLSRDKTCPKCSHVRCVSCVRYPPKRAGSKAQRQPKDMPSSVVTTVAEVPKTGACHECKTEFNMGAPTCTNCDHQICERCLKETVNASPATAPPEAGSTTVAAAA